MSAAKRLERQLLAVARGDSARVPEAGRLVWRWFVALSTARTYNAQFPNPIAFAEIEAFARLHRLPLEPRHVALICALDHAWIEERLADAAAEAKGKPRRTRPTQTITVEAFDAMFS